jgi:hypothetical protein
MVLPKTEYVVQICLTGKTNNLWTDSMYAYADVSYAVDKARELSAKGRTLWATGETRVVKRETTYEILETPA